MQLTQHTASWVSMPTVLLTGSVLSTIKRSIKTELFDVVYSKREHSA